MTTQIVQSESLSFEDLESLKIAVKLLESPTLASKMADFAGKPMAALLEKVPDWAEKHIQTVIKAALQKSMDAAVFTMDNQIGKSSSPAQHKYLTAATGAIGGAFGMASLIVELPVSTTLILRAIADIARSEGFDISALETKIACLEVFSLGGPSQNDDEIETLYYSSRITISQAILAAPQSGRFITDFIAAIAKRFGIVVSSKAAAQAAPLIGAAAGATLNAMFTDYYQSMAMGHFIVKRLEKTYGSEFIKSQYIEQANLLGLSLKD